MLNFFRFLVLLRNNNFRIWYIIRYFISLIYTYRDIKKISEIFLLEKEFYSWLKARKRNVSSFPLRVLFSIKQNLDNQIGMNYSAILFEIFSNKSNVK